MLVNERLYRLEAILRYLYRTVNFNGRKPGTEITAVLMVTLHLTSQPVVAVWKGN
jgi:hypothetical protein